MSTAQGPVAVFGAGGFIGRHLVARLEAMGIETVRPLSKTGARVDIAGPIEEITESLGQARVVVNAAGKAHVHSADPSVFWAANATGARRVAEAAVAAPRVERLVHVSSVAVGAGGLEPEAAAYQPFTAYGASKAAGEIGVHAATSGTPLSVVVVRPAGVGGEDSPGSWGTIRRLVQAGKRVPVPDNHVRHDVIEIEDVVDFLLSAVQGDVPAGVHTLPGPGAVTLAEYAERIAELTGHPARLMPVPEWSLKVAAFPGSVLRRVSRRPTRVQQLVSTLTDQRPLVGEASTDRS